MRALAFSFGDNSQEEYQAMLRYIKNEEISNNPELIFEDVQYILEQSKKEHFLEICSIWQETVEMIKVADAPDSKKRAVLPYVQEKSMETFENCIDMLENSLAKQLSAIDYYHLDKKKAYQMIFDRASEWYDSPASINSDDDLVQYFQTLKLKNTPVPPQNSNFTKGSKHLPIPYSKTSMAMAKMSSRNKQPNAISGQLILESNGVKVKIDGFADMAGVFGVNTHKLFCAGLIQFTNNNNIGDKSDKINCGVSISLKEYAAMCGYDVEEHQTDNPAKEKQRVKNLLKHVRKQIASDLEILYTSSLTWSENTNKRSKDYLDIRIITDKGIKNGYIYMKFNDSFASYLKLRRLTQYPVALFSVDARSANAYRLGQAMSFHYNNDNNIKSHTANRMKISTLLEYTDLPTISEIQKGEHSWADRIKEPFETALDELYQKEILSDWWYCHSGDIVLTDNEAQNFPDFETWKNMLIHFEISQATDHSLRLAAKEEKKDKREVKRKKTKTKKQSNEDSSNN